jgi:hypothetical protein
MAKNKKSDNIKLILTIYQFYCLNKLINLRNKTDAPLAHIWYKTFQTTSQFIKPAVNYETEIFSALATCVINTSRTASKIETLYSKIETLYKAYKTVVKADPQTGVRKICRKIPWDKPANVHGEIRIDLIELVKKMNSAFSRVESLDIKQNRAVVKKATVVFYAKKRFRIIIGIIITSIVLLIFLFFLLKKLRKTQGWDAFFTFLLTRKKLLFDRLFPNEKARRIEYLKRKIFKYKEQLEKDLAKEKSFDSLSKKRQAKGVRSTEEIIESHKDFPKQEILDLIRSLEITISNIEKAQN